MIRNLELKEVLYNRLNKVFNVNYLYDIIMNNC